MDSQCGVANASLEVLEDRRRAQRGVAFSSVRPRSESAPHIVELRQRRLRSRLLLSGPRRPRKPAVLVRIAYRSWGTCPRVRGRFADRGKSRLAAVIRSGASGGIPELLERRRGPTGQRLLATCTPGAPLPRFEVRSTHAHLSQLSVCYTHCAFRSRNLRISKVRALNSGSNCPQFAPRPRLRWMLKLHACNFYSLRPTATVDPTLAKPFPRLGQLCATELFQSLTHVPAKTVGDHIHIPAAAILSADRAKLGLVIAISAATHAESWLLLACGLRLPYAVPEQPPAPRKCFQPALPGALGGQQNAYPVRRLSRLPGCALWLKPELKLGNGPALPDLSATRRGSELIGQSLTSPFRALCGGAGRSLCRHLAGYQGLLGAPAYHRAMWPDDDATEAPLSSYNLSA